MGRKFFIFGDVLVIVFELLNFGYEFDEGFIIFNKFRFVIFYKIEEKFIFFFNIVVSVDSMSIYDDIDVDVL